MYTYISVQCPYVFHHGGIFFIILLLFFIGTKQCANNNLVHSLKAPRTTGTNKSCDLIFFSYDNNVLERTVYEP